MAVTTKMVVLSVKPLGDAVMTIAVARALERLGFTARLHVHEIARGLLAAHGVPLADEAFIEEAKIRRRFVEVGDYLLQDPHVRRMLEGFRAGDDIDRQGFGHLSQWIGRYVARKLEIGFFLVNPQDVVLQMSRDQLVRGRELLAAQAGCPAERVILIVPAAGSSNRLIPPFICKGVHSRLSHRSALHTRLLAPLPKGINYGDLGAAALSFDLVDLPSVLAAAPVVIAADTGPFHVAAAAKAGVSPDAADGAGIMVSPSQVLLVCGSSNPFTLIYEGTQFVLPNMCSCPVISCGAHGYTEPQQHAMLEHRMVFSPEGERSGCIFPEYATTRLAPCMKSVSAAAIASRARELFA